MHDELPHPDVFGRLENCHDRLRRELLSLTAATSALLADHDDPTSLTAVRDAIAYFDRAIVRHEEDEEKSLFPRIAHLPEVEPTLAALHAEHADQRDLHIALRSLVPAESAPDREALQQIDQIARALDRSYAVHLVREEQELFPIAARSLDPETLTTIDREMQARRGGGGGGGGGRGGGGGGGGRGGGGGGGGGNRRD